MAKDKIAVYLPSLEGGGAERAMLTLANGFARRGRSVDLVLARAFGPYLNDIEPCINLVDLRAQGVLDSAPALIRYLRREQPRVLLSAMSHANVVAIAARLIAGVPTRLVVSERTSFTAAGRYVPSRNYRLVRCLMRLTYKYADAVTVVAEAIVDEVAHGLKLDRSRIVNIPNPVVTERLLALARHEPSHAFVVPSGPPLILGVGRLSEEKDFPCLIKAFAQVRKSRVARLLILGEGPGRADLERLIRELRLEEDIDLPGFCANPYAFMRRASVFALSSRFEGLPGVLIEAMAVGTPVVSTDCPTGPAEVLENGRWGELVPINDVDALAAALRETLDAKTHPNVSARAQFFSEDRAVSRYLEVLDGSYARA